MRDAAVAQEASSLHVREVLAELKDTHVTNSHANSDSLELASFQQVLISVFVSAADQIGAGPNN